MKPFKATMFMFKWMAPALGMMLAACASTEPETAKPDAVSAGEVSASDLAVAVADDDADVSTEQSDYAGANCNAGNRCIAKCFSDPGAWFDVEGYPGNTCTEKATYACNLTSSHRVFGVCRGSLT